MWNNFWEGDMNSWELFKNTTKHPQSWKRRWWLPVAHLFRLQIITLKCLTECSFSLWEVNWAVEKTHWDGGDPQRFAPQFHLGTDLTQNTNQSVITPPLHILGDAFAVPHKCRAGSYSSMQVLCTSRSYGLVLQVFHMILKTTILEEL